MCQSHVTLYDQHVRKSRVVLTTHPGLGPKSRVVLTTHPGLARKSRPRVVLTTHPGSRV